MISGDPKWILKFLSDKARCKKTQSIQLSYKTNCIFLHDLFPYDPNKKKQSELRNSLIEYAAILKASQEALKDFIEGNLFKFDALVGENACQIRAVWLAILASQNNLRLPELLERIIIIKNTICILLEQKTISSLMSSKISLKELIFNKNLFVQLNSEQLFIIQCYLLTEAKSSTAAHKNMDSIFIKDKCDPKKLKRLGNISSSFLDNMLSKARKNVAAASVQFVRQNAIETQDQTLIKMLSDPFTINHNNYLLCTPMFWTYKSIIWAAVTRNIPLIIKAKFLEVRQEASFEVVDSDALLFVPSIKSESFDFMIKDLELSDYDKSAWVIEGIVYPQKDIIWSKEEWRKIFLGYSLKSIILGAAADHRQYPKETYDEMIGNEQNHEYETHKSFAKMEGFSFENPTKFFVQHVYPSKLSHILKQKKQFFEDNSLVESNQSAF